MLLIALILALVWGAIWAAFLQFTRIGRFLSVRRTWITVVIGVGVDLGLMLLVVPWDYWWMSAMIIGVSSLPIIARSLYNELTEENKVLDELKNSSGQ